MVCETGVLGEIRRVLGEICHSAEVYKKWLSYSVEGLLLTGPIPSSFFFFSKVVGGLVKGMLSMGPTPQG